MEYKPLALFLLVALMTFGLFILIQQTFNQISDNPLLMLVVFAVIGTSLWLVIQLVMKMNTDKQGVMKASTAILVFVLVGATMFGCFYAYKNNIGGIGDIVDNIKDDITNASNDGGTRLTVYYGPDASGNTPEPRVYDSSDTSLNTLKIIKDGNTVSSIKIELYVTPTWTSDASLTSYSVSGTFRMRIVYSGAASNVYYDSGSVAINAQHPTLTSGSPAVISSATLSASQIEALGNLPTGGLLLEYSNPSPITMTLNFDNGDTVTKSATAPTLNWGFAHAPNTGVSSFTSLSCQFYATKY